MEGIETDNIPRDMPEGDEPIIDEHGHRHSRHKDYWAWLEESRRQLFQDT